MQLARGVRVIPGDWLSCNQVLVSDARGGVLIDAGHVTRADETLATLRRPEHLADRPLQRVILTHAHSDHMGGIATLQRAYGGRVTVPAGEAEAISHWDTRALWLDWAGQQCERFAFDDTLAAGEHFMAGGLRWDALPAPGHDAAALMFWCAEARMLISGDALWENGFGIVLLAPPGGLDAARETLERIAALGAGIVIPGHGKPFTDVQRAVERSLSRVDALRADPRRAARSVLKVNLSFSLMERGRLLASEAARWVERVPMYREYNERYLHLPPGELAAQLIGELEQAGAVRREGDWLLSAL